VERWQWRQSKVRGIARSRRAPISSPHSSQRRTEDVSYDRLVAGNGLSKAISGTSRCRRGARPWRMSSDRACSRPSSC